MADFTTEQLAFNLAKEFRKYYTRYSFKTFKLRNIKSSKWWPHFMKTAEKYINDKDFDYKFFIKIQFETYGKIFPYFLPGKNAEKNYKNNFYKEDAEEKRMLSEINNSKKAIELWCSKHKKDKSQYFSEANDFILKQRANYLSKSFLAFSKSFLRRYAQMANEEKEGVVNKDELNVKRALAKQLGVTRKIKEILDDDYI